MTLDCTYQYRSHLLRLCGDSWKIVPTSFLGALEFTQLLENVAYTSSNRGEGMRSTFTEDRAFRIQDPNDKQRAAPVNKYLTCLSDPTTTRTNAASPSRSSVRVHPTTPCPQCYARGIRIPGTNRLGLLRRRDWTSASFITPSLRITAALPTRLDLTKKDP